MTRILLTFDKDAVADWAERHLAPDCEVHTDDLGAFKAVTEQAHASGPHSEQMLRKATNHAP